METRQPCVHNYCQHCCPRNRIFTQRLVILKLNLGKSHRAIRICNSVQVLVLICLEVNCLLHLLRIHHRHEYSRWHSRTWRLKSISVEWCNIRLLPVSNQTAVTYSFRGDWFLCIKRGELNDLNIYLQEVSRRKFPYIFVLKFKSFSPLGGLTSIWTYLLF